MTPRERFLMWAGYWSGVESRTYPEDRDDRLADVDDFMAMLLRSNHINYMANSDSPADWAQAAESFQRQSRHRWR